MRRRTSCLWWEGMVLPHPLVNVGHSMKIVIMRVMCILMNNTFSACPQVSDTACVASSPGLFFLLNVMKETNGRTKIFRASVFLLRYVTYAKNFGLGTRLLHVLSQCFSERIMNHFRWMELTQGHRRSSSSMQQFHTNKSRREEGCYVWWLG